MAVHVTMETLNEWNTQISNGLEDYKQNLTKVERVIEQVKDGDIAGDPATAFENEYEKVRDFLHVQIPNKFEDVIELIEDKEKELDKTIENINSRTNWSIRG